MNIVCVISARGGSKGLPNKNVKPLLGKPLIGWSIEQAQATGLFDAIFVSTDSEQIAEVARNYGAIVPSLRPIELATSEAAKWDVWREALSRFEDFMGKPIDLYVDLDCTSPLRSVDDIRQAIRLFHESDTDAVFSVCEARKNPYFNLLEETATGFVVSKKIDPPIVRRQDAPKVWEHVASIYVLSPEFLRHGENLLSGRTIGYDIGQDRSLDIDSDHDFNLVSMLLEQRLKHV